MNSTLLGVDGYTLEGSLGTESKAVAKLRKTQLHLKGVSIE